jgi:DNA-binding transcriptional MerR regulator/effector-binding domain-containing protein
VLDWRAGERPTIGFMRTRISIGDFAQMTHLSVKALRHYHDVGVLDPAQIDMASGYRYYEPGQIVTAQVIRRFRDLGMPLDDIRALLTAPDVTARSEVIIGHLERMESQLSQTQAAVASLRTLLERPRQPAEVEHRSVGPALSVAVAERVTESGLADWWSAAFGELYATLTAAGVQPDGLPGALYPAELFESEVGEVVAFVPVSSPVARSGRVAMREIPAAELAVAVHRGPFAELDQTYAELGKYVTAREIGVDGPIREYYVVSYFDTTDESRHVTEVCWPVFHTGVAG